jgi:hypothetical protein
VAIRSRTAVVRGPSHQKRPETSDVGTIRSHRYVYWCCVYSALTAASLATSPDVRRAIAENPNVPDLLRSVDKLYGPLRQQALEEMLGVGTSAEQRHGTRPQTHDTLARIRQEGDAESNMRTLRQLSEAIEKAIGVGDAQRGLAWEDE